MLVTASVLCAGRCERMYNTFIVPACACLACVRCAAKWLSCHSVHCLAGDVIKPCVHALPHFLMEEQLLWLACKHTSSALTTSYVVYDFLQFDAHRYVLESCCAL